MPVVKQKAKQKEVRVVLHKLHAGQAHVDALPHRFVVVMCGRRWGKTAFGIRRACKGALDGKSIGWFAPTYKYALEAWRELTSRLGPAITRVSEQDKRMELATGGMIEVWTLDGDDPARGRKYHEVIVDEAGLASDLLGVYQSAIRPTLVDYRGKALFLGTPKGRRHGFVVLFNRGLEGGEEWMSVRAPTLANPYIPPEEVESARKELPPEVFAQEFEGIPTDDGANPFGLDAVRGSVGALSKHPTVCFGLDLARAGDWSVLLGLDAWRRVTFLERWQAPWAVTKEKTLALTAGLPVVADATGVGDPIVADLYAMGVDVTPFVFTQPSKLRLMQRLVAAFQGKELTIPAGWLKEELETFEFTYTATGVRYEAPKGFNDDGVMALGLALHAWDRVQGVPPTDTPPPAGQPDDTYLVQAAKGGGLVLPSKIGDFQAQLPLESW